MAGGAFGAAEVGAKARAEQYQGRVTCYVVVACMVAAVGGSLFGYDVGISGKRFSCLPYTFKKMMHACNLVVT